MAVVGGPSILSRRVRKALTEHLSAGEEVLFCLRGNFDQAVIALPSRLLVIKPGFMAGATFGSRITTFSYADITGIEVNTGLLSGVIEISTPSYQATAEKDYWATSKDRDPAKISNCLPIVKSDLKHYQPYLEQLRARVAAAKRPTTTTVTNGGIVDQLKELAALRAARALTDEEFEKAKRQILGQ